jgi:hypothetical protein
MVKRALQVPVDLSEGQIGRWVFLRSLEWENWPGFVSQPVVPILFIFCKWFYVLAGAFILNVLWAGIRYRYVSVRAATGGMYFVMFCKWPTAIGGSIYLFTHGSHLAGILALAWPMGLCGFIGVPGQTGRIELMFARGMGYVEQD